MNLDAHLVFISIMRILYGICMHLSVFQLDTFCNLLHVVSRHILVQEHMVHLFLQILRVGQFAGQVTVVCQQQHTRGITIQTSNRIDALGTHVLHQIHHRLTLLRIITGGDVVFRFVEQHINFLFQRYRLIMKHHLIGAHDLGSQFRHHFTVHLNHTGLYVLIGLATTAHAGIRQILIQTNGYGGINMLFTVFNALLQAILGIGIVIGRTLTIAATIVVATILLSAPVAVAASIVASLLARLISTFAITVITWTIAALLTRLITAFAIIVVAWAIATLLTRLITTFTIIVVTRTIAALLPRLITALTIVVVAWTIATLLARLITLTAITGTISALLTMLIEAGTISTLLCATLLIGLQIATKAFWAETSYLV